MADNAMSRSDALIERHSARLDAAARHPLLRAMGCGSIGTDTFIRYLAHEGAFVRIAARANGYLVWQAPDWAAAKGHAHVLADLVGPQEEYFSSIGIRTAVESLENSPGPLGRHVLAAQREGYGAVVACFCAAETLYARWCIGAPQDAGRTRDVDQWIRLHTARAFTASVAFWHSRVDALGETEFDDRQLDRWFGGMLDAEDAFHDLPLQSGEVSS